MHEAKVYAIRIEDWCGLMIRSFGCRETEKLWHGQRITRFPDTIVRRAIRKLRLIDSASHVFELSIPAGNHLEALKGKRTGQWSIRINGQWRVCFRWVNHEAHDVEIVDYH